MSTTSHPPVSGPEADAPLRVGDHAALDFLNSVFTPRDEPIDLLRDGASLSRWLENSGAVPASAAQGAALLSTAQLNLAAAEARALREWFRELLFRWSVVGARGIRAADLEQLNTMLAKGPLQQRLVREADGLALHDERPVDSPSALLAQLASACADLLATHRAEQVRKCENPACTLWFADTKRGPRRRWCSMAVCGNRMKVAAHRARHRADAGAPDA